MPTRETAPAGAPCWIDLTTSDPARSRDFYTALLGWEAEEPNPDFGGYFNYRRDGVRVAGCMVSQQPGMPDTWSVYLATDDAAKTVERAKSANAQVLFGPDQVADLGTMAFLVDPSGAGVGVWQPGAHKGFTVYAEPNAPGWFELHTTGYEQAVQFYQDVFDWNTRTESDIPQFRYTTQQHDGELLAGVMDSTAIGSDEPVHWAVYFTVTDVDATVEKAGDLGASVVYPAMDTPYGRIAVLADPTGAQFRLVDPTRATPMG